MSESKSIQHGMEYEIDANSCWRGSWKNVRMGCTLVANPMEAIQRPWRQLKQIHSTTIINDTQYRDPSQQADGLITDQGQTLCIKTADCVPILITDGKRLGAIHGGWRGVKAGIVEKLDEYFQLKDCLAVIGPCISAEHYEVDQDLYGDWLVQNPEIEPFLHVVSPQSTKRMFNLKGLVRSKLAQLGVESVVTIPICTYQSPLPSYRRDAPHKSSIFHYIYQA